MGFFSADCVHCAHPLLSTYASNEINAWMMHAVAITANGSVLVGQYDGYGRIGEIQVPDFPRATCWHYECWQRAGSPAEYRGPSTLSADQGFFFTTEHDVSADEAFDAGGTSPPGN
jgi:hypothetical protein